MRALPLAFLVAGLAMPSVVLAADMAPPKELPPEAKAADPLIGFSFGTRYQTDYNFRGVSQSNNQGSYQTFFETQYFDNLLYAGFATFQTRLPTQPDMEFDLIAGVRKTIGKFSFDAGFYYYFYPNEKRISGIDGFGATFPITTANSEFFEGGGKILYAATDALTLGANVFHSPSFFGTHAVSTYVSGTAAYIMPASWFSFLPDAYSSGFSLSGELGEFLLGAAKTSATGFNPAIGRFNSFDLPSYTYGNVGISYAYKNLLLDVRYHDTSLTPRECFNLTGDYRGFINGGSSRWCGSTFIGSVTWQASTAAPGVFAEPGGLLNFFK